MIVKEQRRSIEKSKMRLIDADKMKIGISEKIKTSSEASRFIDIINEQPTAYDVEAVCTELSKRADESRKYWQKYDDEQAFGEVEAYCESIIVVRNGEIIGG